MIISEFHCWFNLSLLGWLASLRCCPVHVAQAAFRPSTACLGTLPENTALLAADVTLTDADRALLSDYSERVYKSERIRKVCIV